MPALWGYPLKGENRSKTAWKSPKRRRLPNRFSQIHEIKGRNQRKPFRALISSGKDSTGRPLTVLLKQESYFETYNEAYTALLEYNKNPYNLSPSITVSELYTKWTGDYFKTNIKKTTITGIERVWGYIPDDIKRWEPVMSEQEH